MTGEWLGDLPDEAPHLLVCDAAEWSALYIDGRLDKCGETYLVEERIRELAGVVSVRTADFLQGGNRYSDVATTFENLVTYRSERVAREEKAAALRAQARDLERQAMELLKVES